MTPRATFNLYVALPDGWGVEQMEQVTVALMGTLAAVDVRTLAARWSCPTLGRGQTPPGPVLVFPVQEGR